MTDAGRRFPWDRMMELGLGALRLSPREFWAATPREIAAAFPARLRRDALTRPDLDELLTRYPDEA